jgi:glycosyltransferase involved in cell wall biosynthesis
MPIENSTVPLSVVMPVRNAMPHLDEAVRSILNQSLGTFEFVILDDASSDGSTERLREWAKKDSRIRLFEVKHNLGPVGSSAFVVAHSNSAIIARMDADDVCSHERLQQQFDLLRTHPKVGLVGTLFEMIDGSGRRTRETDVW